jgi:predicted phage terminase large subunit-like protein
MQPTPLNAWTIEGFCELFLLEHFEERRPIADCHRSWWRLMCDPHPRIAFAAPRGHAKTTGANHTFGLAASLFKAHPYQLKVSKTYELACERVGQAKQELISNAKLRDQFGFNRFEKDRENDFIAEFKDGYRFRMQAIGMNQAVRGMTWGTKRPSLIQGDDMEDDEEVLSKDRRDKGLRWVLNTLLPMGGDRTLVRIYGTVLHQDSVLVRLMRNKSWKSARYEACDAEVSPESILWPEKFSRARLLEIKQMYVDGNEDAGSMAGLGVSGFNMEYRNVALNLESGFFRPEDFRPMTEEDHKRPKRYYVGGDLAFSKQDRRDFTVFVVGGLDEDGILHMVDERRGRWDGNEVIDQMYQIQEAWEPEEWFIESGAIKETLGAALELRMAHEGYFNICPKLIPTKDKAIRAVPFQARMRSRGIRWDTEASWFQDHKHELLEFSQEGTRGPHDDRVDAGAWLGQGIKRMNTPQSSEEEDEEDLWMARKEAKKSTFDTAGSRWTGYHGQR